ncbi:MAG: hypothetical protein ACLQGU_06805 [bacterium]
MKRALIVLAIALGVFVSGCATTTIDSVQNKWGPPARVGRVGDLTTYYYILDERYSMLDILARTRPYCYEFTFDKNGVLIRKREYWVQPEQRVSTEASIGSVHIDGTWLGQWKSDLSKEEGGVILLIHQKEKEVNIELTLEKSFFPTIKCPGVVLGSGFRVSTRSSDFSFECLGTVRDKTMLGRYAITSTTLNYRDEGTFTLSPSEHKP